MILKLKEKIKEGSSYIDIYGKRWLARYNPVVNEIQLWRSDTGFGLWCDGQNIIKRVQT